MPDYNRRLGAYGESLAASFLKRRGCRLIARNCRNAGGEIDLIAAAGDEILFVEVKTRTASDFGWPELAVDWKKMIHLKRAAQAYLENRRISSRWRIDIIAVIIDKSAKSAKIRWFKDAGQES